MAGQWVGDQHVTSERAGLSDMLIVSAGVLSSVGTAGRRVLEGKVERAGCLVGWVRDTSYLHTTIAMRDVLD
jgi:hypothetical protein